MNNPKLFEHATDALCDRRLSGTRGARKPEVDINGLQHKKRGHSNWYRRRDVQASVFVAFGFVNVGMFRQKFTVLGSSMPFLGLSGAVLLLSHVHALSGGPNLCSDDCSTVIRYVAFRWQEITYNRLYAKYNSGGGTFGQSNVPVGNVKRFATIATKEAPTITNDKGKRTSRGSRPSLSASTNVDLILLSCSLMSLQPIRSPNRSSSSAAPSGGPTPYSGSKSCGKSSGFNLVAGSTAQA